jgi:hypothetical protein
MMGETNMSTQNQTASISGKSNNMLIQKMRISLEEIQKVISEKITFIRKTHLLIGFNEASLATELDRNRECSKQLYNLEWNDTVEDYLASEIVADMQARDEIINEWFLKIQSLKEELAEAEKELNVSLAHKRSFIKKS